MARDRLELRRGRRSVTLTRLDRVFWPKQRITKRHVVEYYRAIAPVLVPHLRDRPFTIKRHFTVPRGPFEWVKDAPPELPDWVPTSAQPAKSRGGDRVNYPLVNDALTLLWMVEYGAIDMHVWPSRVDRPDRPDYVVFDLDPAEAAFRDVVRVAVLLREALAALELDCVVRTTGGDGLHVLVPVARRHTHEQAREFSEIVADALARTTRGLVTTERSLARRRGVFVDTQMNGHGQQLGSVYSVRPRAEAAVATPLRWDEVSERLDPHALGMREALLRVDELGDLAAPLLHGRQRLDRALARLVEP